MIKVSHSQLGQFDRCHYAWHLSHEEGWAPKTQPSYFALGSLVHEFLATYYKNFGNGTEQILSCLDAQLQQKYSEVGNDADAILMVSHAYNMVKRYMDYSFLHDGKWNILEVEKHLSVVLTTPNGNEFILEGVLDLLYTTPNGKLWLVDHKTANGAQNFFNDIEVMMDPQLPTYALALEKATGMEVFGITYNMLNSYEYKKKAPLPDQLFKRIDTYRSKIEQENHLINLGNMVDEMIEIRSQNRRKKSMRRDCSKCQFQEPCLAEMKGIDPMPLFEANFVNKNNLLVPEATVSQDLTSVGLFGTV